MIPKETVDRIIDTAQIEEVVGDFVSLKRRGASLIACCPFHHEKTPSFYVTPSKGIFKCFGCGKSGTAVKFIMEHEGVTYPDALKYLAKKYNIDVVETEETAEQIVERQHIESLYLVSEFAQKYFASQLNTAGDGHTLGYAYFKSRGLEDDTIVKYGLGWAPKGRHGLAQEATRQGYKTEYLVETGLCHKNEDGTLNDRFYDRVMFPIHSTSGRVIAFGGRTLQGGHPAMKYVNTPTTTIYAKEKSLYGLWFAKSEMARRNKCYLVEGYLDVLSMHQLGIINTVASSGTSLTIEQIRLIRKFTDNITIMYDGDNAGINAAIRGIDLILQEGMNVKIVLIPGGDDPDSYAKKHSLAEVEQFIQANEQDFITFKTRFLLESSKADPLKKAELINDIADTIALIPDAIKRSVYGQATSDTFGIDQNIMFARIATTREKILANNLKQKEREQRLTANTGAINDALQHSTNPQVNNVNSKNAPTLQNPNLAPIEKDFMWFILKYGTRPLIFSAESEFESGFTVADFIRGNLESEHRELENDIYKNMYNAYFTLYDADETLTQEDIIKQIINAPDQDMATQVLEIINENHLLTLKNLKDSITQIDTILATYVPRSLMVYQIKCIQDSTKKLMLKLSQANQPEEQNSILVEMQELSLLRKIFEEKLGRVL